MQLSQLLSQWHDARSMWDQEIGNVVIDSRQVETGDVFCALALSTKELQTHIQQALTNKAACVLVDNDRLDECHDSPLLIGIPQLSSQLQVLAAQRYGIPTLTLFAVTGTNGKTSVAWMGAQLFSSLGFTCGYIGTLGARLGGGHWETHHTTPDIFSIYRLLAAMQLKGAQACFIEASSHALVQHRLAGLSFACGVFTNLTQEHLDYHGTMQHYQAAKWRLWSQCEKIIANSDDPYSAALPKDKPQIRCGSCTEQEPDVLLSSFRASLDGVTWEVTYEHERMEFNAPIVGLVMLENLLVLTTCALVFGYQYQDIFSAMHSIKAPPGRIQKIHSQPTVLIDYAHTPDALTKLLNSLQAILIKNQRLGVVFGCGGNRDKSKRAPMGAIATKLADKAFITSDNPRDEDPRAIIDEIVTGVEATELYKFTCEPDRRKAIFLALDWSKEEDCLVIAGKGHETIQEVNGNKLPFNDAELVKEYFAHVG